jgi:ribonuclease E
VIVRTAAEGASEEELSRDVARLSAQWEAIERKAKTANAPELLYSEPDLTIRVVRDIFNEDFSKLVVASDSEWDMVDEYVQYVAPHLAARLERWQADRGQDVFAAYRIDEQLAKALERKVWLPSGGSLVFDPTEAMTVIDVNTGKFTGQGGNLEQTVTRNNLEAAEEIVRQLRLRDIGGIIVIDFIDMVLESNRELVLRRLLECLARDRTKHQVAEVTSLGLVQMTRKRVGSGLLEAFSVPCEHCSGRGVIVSLEPVDHASGRRSGDDGAGRSGRKQSDRPRGGRSRSAPKPAAAGAAASGAAAQADGSAERAATVAAGAGEQPDGAAQRDAARPDGGVPEGPGADVGQPGNRPGPDGPADPGEPAPDSGSGDGGAEADSRRAAGRRRRRGGQSGGAAAEPAPGTASAGAAADSGPDSAGAVGAAGPGPDSAGAVGAAGPGPDLAGAVGAAGPIPDSSGAGAAAEPAPDMAGASGIGSPSAAGGAEADPYRAGPADG